MKLHELPELVITGKGDITFPNIYISQSPRKLTPEACRNVLKQYESKNEWNVGNGYTWQYYHVNFEGKEAFLSYCFLGVRLVIIAINVILPDEKLIDNWPTEETSKREVKFIQKAFRKQFGGRLKYGKPYCFFDMKSFSAHCGITYLYESVANEVK